MIRRPTWSRPPGSILLAAVLVLVVAGCATRWDGHGTVTRLEDRIAIIGLSWKDFNFCEIQTPLWAMLRERNPDLPPLSCHAVTVDMKGQPPNFYLAARSTSELPASGIAHFSFIGSSTLADCERLRAQFIEAKSLADTWVDVRCRPAVLTVR